VIPWHNDLFGLQAVKQLDRYISELNFLLNTLQCDTGNHHQIFSVSRPGSVTGSDEAIPRISVYGHKPRSSRGLCNASESVACMDIADLHLSGCSRRSYRTFTAATECADTGVEKITALITLSNVNRAACNGNQWVYVHHGFCCQFPLCYVDFIQEIIHEEVNKHFLASISKDPIG
jgi:hypothetical protein